MDNLQQIIYRNIGKSNYKLKCEVSDGQFVTNYLLEHCRNEKMKCEVWNGQLAANYLLKFGKMRNRNVKYQMDNF